MTQNNDVYHGGRHIRNQTKEQACGDEQSYQQPKPLPPICQSTAQVITERESDENHTNLAYPNVERAAKILRQEASSNDLQNHHNKTADEHQGRCCRTSHRAKIVV